MVSVQARIQVNEHGIYTWGVFVYTKHILPTQLYLWLHLSIKKLNRIVECSITRIEPKHIRVPTVAKDDMHSPFENDVWISIKMQGYQDKPITMQQIEKHILKRSPFWSYITKDGSTSNHFSAEWSGAVSWMRPRLEYQHPVPGSSNDPDLVYFNKCNPAELGQLADATEYFVQEQFNFNKANEIFLTGLEQKYDHRLLVRLGQHCRLLGGHWTAYFNDNHVKECGKENTQLSGVLEFWHAILRGFLFGEFVRTADGAWNRKGLAFSPADAVTVRKREDKGLTVAVSNPITDVIAKLDTSQEIHGDEQVFKVEKSIRSCLCGDEPQMELKYKADVYSACKILHGHHQRGLRPTVYKSRYECAGRRSIITTDYTEGYTPQVQFNPNQVWYNFID